MTQVGSLSPATPGPIIFEDDFETYQSNVALPQCSADASVCPCATGICLDYWQTGSARVTNKEFKFGGQSLLVQTAGQLGLNIVSAPIVSKPIDVISGQQYVLTVWLNSKDATAATGVAGPLSNTFKTQIIEANNPANIFRTIIQEAPNQWVKYITPFTPNVGQIQIRFFLEGGNPEIAAGSKAYVDMLSLAPVLEIQSPADAKTLSSNYIPFNNGTSYAPYNNEDKAYSDRSCRIYAKPDALSCKYRERNTGREIQGWRGFCAESDPKNPEYCLQWWPIDLIEGEDISKF